MSPVWEDHLTDINKLKEKVVTKHHRHVLNQFLNAAFLSLVELKPFKFAWSFAFGHVNPQALMSFV